MGMKIGQDDEPIVDINITPFVDIVLVLLVIFMVTAHFIINKGMNVDLPKAASATSLAQKNITLSLLKNGSLVFKGKPFAVENIKQALDKELSGTNADFPTVTLNADKEVSYDMLIRVMDSLRLQGVTQFAFQVDSSLPKN